MSYTTTVGGYSLHNSLSALSCHRCHHIVGHSSLQGDQHGHQERGVEADREDQAAVQAAVGREGHRDPTTAPTTEPAVNE